MRRPLSALQRIFGRSGFTLIELLVVIGVLGILASMLLPALTRARQTADSAACKSNLRQAGIALMLYTQDHGAYPTLWATSTQIWLSNWKRALSEYLGTHSVSLSGNESLLELLSSVRISPVLECPSRTGNRQTAGETSRTYGYNFWGYNGSFYSSLQRSGLGGNAEADRIIPVKDSEVLVPVNMLAIGDGFTRSAGLIPGCNCSKPIILLSDQLAIISFVL